jgi:Cu-Zn family superoxide dismutase
MEVFMRLGGLCAIAIISGLALSGASANDAKAPLTAKAIMKNAEGKDVGRVELTAVSDGVLMKLALKGLPPGGHAFHVHAVGKCEPPFTSAGGHFNPQNKKHGMMAADGHHAGDMPNLDVPSSGELTIELVNNAVSLDKSAPNSLFKSEGTSLVIHAVPDDYKSDPAGNAGGRIACGVIEQ